VQRQTTSVPGALRPEQPACRSRQCPKPSWPSLLRPTIAMT